MSAPSGNLFLRADEPAAISRRCECRRCDAISALTAEDSTALPAKRQLAQRLAR